MFENCQYLIGIIDKKQPCNQIIIINYQEL